MMSKVPQFLSQSVSVLYLVDAWLQLDSSLHYVGCSIEGSAMLLLAMPPLVLEGTKHFEVSIDCLMPSSCLCKHALQSSIVASRSEAVSVRVTVDAISNKQLSRAECLVQCISANAQVSVPTSRVGTIDPHNPTSLDADSNLVPEACMLPLVGAPLAPHRM